MLDGIVNTVGGSPGIVTVFAGVTDINPTELFTVVVMVVVPLTAILIRVDSDDGAKVVKEEEDAPAPLSLVLLGAEA